MSFALFTPQKTQYALDLPPFVEAEHSKRAKRMALRVDHSKGIIRLVIPHRTSHAKIQHFVDLQRSWIEEQSVDLKTGIPFLHDTKIPVLGTLHRLNITYSDALKKTSIKLINKEIAVSTNKPDPSSRIERHLRKLAKDTLSDMSEDKAARIDKTISSVSIRDTKSRWGSCSASGALSYSWRLIFAPYEAMDYVVAHEVAHLQHLDHSKAFWNLCSKLSDDYVEGKYWMQNHGAELMRYGRR